jgi:hypothetical protein
VQAFCSHYRVQTVDDIYLEDIFSYSLYLAVDVPPVTGIDSAHLRSPLLTIGCFNGLNTDPDAPAWSRLAPRQRFEFRQPRGAIAELFSALAFWRENSSIVRYFPTLFTCSDSEFSVHCLAK